MNRDNREQQKEEHGLSPSRDFCLPFLDGLPTPIWRSGTDGRCDYFNRMWLDFTGRSLEEELGDGWIGGVHPDDVERVLNEYRTAFDRRELFALEYRRRRHDGEYRQIVDYGKPYKDLEGAFAGYIGEIYDNTERELVLARLRKSEAQFAEAQALAHVGSWEWDLTTHSSAWSDEHYRIMGLKPQEFPQNYEAFMRSIHPDDRERIHEDTLRVQRERTPQNHEFRVVLPDGEIRFLHGRGSFALDETGHATRMFGTVQDITERKRAEESLRESETRFRQLAENISEVFWLVDPEMTRIDYISPAYEKVWGRSCESLYQAPRSWIDSIHPADRERIALAMQQYRATGAQYKTHHTYQNYRLLRSDGTTRWIRARAYPIRDTDGKLIRIAGFAEDITEMAEANEKLQLLSRRLIEIQENERRSLSRELHDEIGQTLTAVKIGLQTAQTLDDLPTARQHLGDSVALVDQVLQQVRQIALDLRPSILDHLGLVPALRWYFDQQRRRSKLKIDFRHGNLSLGISAEILTVCYRIAQEAMTNILRHAQAQNVVVDLRELNGTLEFSMKDDGIGFDVQQSKSRASLGLVGMRERALLVGGSLDVTSQPTHGTTILARLPLVPPPRVGTQEIPE
jgi:PAS domain S-box-containing protein